MNEKRILILAYDFPPYNSIGAQRPYSWYLYFKKYGYYPVVVTRHWDTEIRNPVDYVRSSNEKNVTVEESVLGTIIRVPYKSNLRDRLFLKYRYSGYQRIRRLITFINHILGYLTLRWDNTAIFYDESEKYIRANRCDWVLATGEPFSLFRYAYLLNKKFGIPWIADYRDEWTTNKIRYRNPIEKYILKYYYRYFEKKYVHSALFTTTAAPVYMHNMLAINPDKVCEVIYNGYVEEEFNFFATTETDLFQISYAGLIYDFQPVEIFLEGYLHFLENHDFKIQSSLNFFGLKFYPDQHQRIMRFCDKLIPFINTSDRLKKPELFANLARASMLLLLASPEEERLAAKVFEYLRLKRRILMVKDDKGILARIIQESRSGVICSTPEEVTKELSVQYEEFVKRGYLSGKTINFSKYSRENQARRFCQLLDESSYKTFTPVAERMEHFRSAISGVMNALQVPSVLSGFNQTRQKVTVLCLHSISNEVNVAYPPLKIRVFEKLLKYIDKHYEVIRLQDIGENRIGKRPKLVITFDDGFRDFIDNALPLLVKYRMPATNNVIINCVETGVPFWTQRLNNILNYIYHNLPGYELVHGSFRLEYKNRKSFMLFNKHLFEYLLNKPIEERLNIISEAEASIEDFNPFITKMMSWEELRECVSNGIEIGSHTVSHDSLVTIQDKADRTDELLRSKMILDEHLNVQTQTLSFPNGLYNLQIAEESIDVGYNFLLTTEDKLYDFQNYLGLGAHLVPRISVDKHSFEENILRINNFHSIFRNQKSAN